MTFRQSKLSSSDDVAHECIGILFTFFYSMMVGRREGETGRIYGLFVFFFRPIIILYKRKENEYLYIHVQHHLKKTTSIVETSQLYFILFI